MFGKNIKKNLFLLDESIVVTNNGSYGTIPKKVKETQWKYQVILKLINVFFCVWISLGVLLQITLHKNLLQGLLQILSVILLTVCQFYNFDDVSLANLVVDQLDQYQYLGNCPPTPPLTQH